MSWGDESPRYTYMMDFNPMDEDTPLRDYWQTTDDLGNEDAATIASLATQVLQSKSGYEYGEGIEVNEPSLVANYMYSESRSSPQSQHSTTMPTEPAESFRGLMEDHDRGARMLEESAASEYDFDPETRRHESTDVAGIEESTELPREQYAPEPFRSMLSVTADVGATDQGSYTHEIEMSAAMTASRVVNGVLSRSYAGTPTEEAVNLQALQSQAPQLTPSHSESRSVSLEPSDRAEQENEPTMETDEQHVDEEDEEDEEGESGKDKGKTIEDEGERVEDEGEREEDKADREEDEADGEEDEADGEEDEADREEDGKGEMEGDEREEMEKDEQDEEELTPDTGAQQQLLLESNQRSIVERDEGSPPLQQTPSKRGRPRRSDAAEASPTLTIERSITTRIPVRDYDGPDLSRAEEMPAERQRSRSRGRPRKSEASEDVLTERKRSRSRGRPRKSEAPEEMPAVRQRSRSRGRPRKSEALEEIPTEQKRGRSRGRPRKSEISEPTAATPAKRGPGRPPKATALKSTVEATPATGKRGRPRKNSMVDAAQTSAIALDLSAVETPTTTPTTTPVQSKRGRPRKTDAMGAAETSTSSTQLPVVGAVATGVPSGKRGRPRKSDVFDAAQTNAAQETSITQARTASKRGRPRKSDMLGAALASTNEAQEAAIAPVRASSKRGRPRKSNAVDIVQASTDEVQEAAVTVARASSKRGRPRKSDMTGAAQASTEELEPLAVEKAATATPASNKRGRPPKGDAIGTTQVSTEELQLSSIEAPVTATPVLSKRGRPRKSDMMGATPAQVPAQVPAHEAQLPAVEGLITTTPASDERGPPPKASATISTITSGKRGRPPKNTVPLLQAEMEILPIDDSIWTFDSPLVKSTGWRGRPPRQADTLEERDVSPTPLSAKRRSRGRPPKNQTLSPADLSNTTIEPVLDMDAQEAEPQEPSKSIDDVSKDLAVGETASTPAHEDTEATPARKRGRPKAATVDKPLSVVDMFVTASAKKRGRPTTAIAAIDSAEEHGQPVQWETQEEEEEPAAKRRRTNNDTTMEDAVDENETRGDAQTEELPSVEELREAVSANGTTRKRSSVTWAKPISSTLTEPKTAIESSPQPDGGPRLSGEMLEESTRTKKVEQPPTAPKPKTLFDMISDGRKMVRQKTYGKRSKR